MSVTKRIQLLYLIAVMSFMSLFISPVADSNYFNDRYASAAIENTNLHTFADSSDSEAKSTTCTTELQTLEIGIIERQNVVGIVSAPKEDAETQESVIEVVTEKQKETITEAAEDKTVLTEATITEQITECITDKTEVSVETEITVEAEISEKTETTAEAITEETINRGVLSRCNFTKEQLQNGLSGNLINYAEYFLEAEETYGVNATFLAAVAAAESGWGTSSLALNNNNLFGWKGSSSYMRFDSVEECIMHVAKALKNNYLTPGGSCFRGYEISDVNKCYCGTEQWVNLVSGIMYRINANASDAT